MQQTDQHAGQRIGRARGGDDDGIAAVGGMALPALIFVLVNRNDADHLDGWAIPAATDIAFAMGVLAILGSRVPIAVRVLLGDFTVTIPDFFLSLRHI